MGHPDKPYTICILAGEASGDLHGAELIEALKKRRPHLEIFGMGGDRMAAQGAELLYHVRDLSIMGIVEVLRHLPFIRRVARRLKAEILRRRPDLVIFVDYPGFNLRFAKTVKSLGIPTLYYISPKVWAWGKRRIGQMASRVDRLLVIFPFETDVYAQTGLDVRFVGNPLRDMVKPQMDRDTFFASQGLNSAKPLVALLPGSRRHEVEGLLPEMLIAVQIAAETVEGLQCVVAAAPTLGDETYARILGGRAPWLRNQTYDLVAHANVAMVASGTATLETTLLGTPHFLCYKTAPLTYWMARLLVKIQFIGLANIVAGRQITRELIQHEASAETMAAEAVSLLTDTARRERMQADMAEVSALLGEPGAADRAADALLEMLEPGD